MKERPILFQGAMVRALLDGSKTQTRRLVKADIMHDQDGGQDAKWYLRRWNRQPCWDSYEAMSELVAKHCPFGKPGDRLWVRETWVCDHFRVQSGPYLEVDGAREHLFYRADNDHPFEAPEGKFWKPSIHMPRWASRIPLEIVSVRVERLNDCSADDAIAEGIDRVANNYGNGPAYCDYRAKNQEDMAEWLNSPLDSYRTLWESINGAGSWSANPWVWVVEFRRMP